MITICKVKSCPYRSSSGFCRNRLLVVNGNGQCGHLYFPDGKVRNDWSQAVDQIYMDGYKPQEEKEK